MTLDLIAWALPAAYVVHMLDETLVNGGFVGWVGRSFWPGYSMRMFFWFNAGAVVLIAASNLLFDLFGGRLVILPLVGIFGFALHGVTVHVFWTVRQRDYSPGLVTSVLYWIVAVVAHGGLNLKPGRTPSSASPVLKRAAANGDRTILGTPGQRVSATEIDSRPTTVL